MTTHRSLLIAALCMTASAAACLAQVHVSFSGGIASPTAPMARNVYAVDVNNDGIPDLIQDRAQAPNGFTVSIANGNGTFRAPVSYSVPTGGFLSPIATGDFNGDGKVDIVLALTGTNQVDVFFGNGDGTFQAPKPSAIAFPSAETIDAVPIAAADFNQDGKLDLIVAASNATTQTLFVVTGDGTGGIQEAVSPIPIYNPFAGTSVNNIAIGDFDRNNKADVAFTVTTACSNGSGVCGTALHVLFNNGGIASFEDTTPYTSPDLFTLGSGDLNSDGATDLFILDNGANQLVVFYASSRTFAPYFFSLPNPGVGNSPRSLTGDLVMADFNDDGQMDLAAVDNVPLQGGGTTQEVLFFLSNGHPGQFTMQVVATGAAGPATNLVVGDFNADTRPDLALVQSSGTSPYINAFLNSTSHGSWSNCQYPLQGKGINLCSPLGLTTSPLLFNAAASSYGMIRKMELWVDGVKIQQQSNTWGHNAWMTFPTSYNPGPHSATLFAADVDNSLQMLNFNFTVGPAPCAAPSSPGVHICTPTNGPANSSPVQVSASANITGSLVRMEVWVDGVKKFTESNGTYLGAMIALPPGTHQFAVVAVNSSGTVWQQSVSVAVK